MDLLSKLEQSVGNEYLATQPDLTLRTNQNDTSQANTTKIVSIKNTRQADSNKIVNLKNINA